MTWTLLLIVFGAAVTSPPAISTDMKFVDQKSCEESAARLRPILKAKTSWTPVVECVDTAGRE
ncbi:MAG: hypothetical protein O9972_39750 [Burkholderiales bacterium]|nr:hypothetical protein [Burkholderiales bacterium]